MVRFLSLFRFVTAAIWLPGAMWACDYPGPLRAISTTLMSVQEGGGQVGNYHRSRLRQALGQMDVVAVQNNLAGILGRADRRAVAAMLILSQSLANGMGRSLSAGDADQARQLAQSIRTTCPADTQAKAKSTPSSQALEQGESQLDGDGSRALTFRQGLARLSLTFSVYMTFLAFVIGLRRQWKRTMHRAHRDSGPPPGGRAFSPKEHEGLKGI